MKLLKFICNIFKKFPFALITNISLLVAASLIDIASVFSLIVVIDLFLKPGLQGISPITSQIIKMIKFVGLPVTLSWLLAVLMIFNIIKVAFQIFAQYSIIKTKYTVLRDILLGTFEDFFNARWYFFSSSQQGTLLNTFTREITTIGDSFGAMARYFSGILQIMLYLVVPFYLSWQVTSVTVILALIFALPFFLLGRISYRLGKQNTATSNQLISVIHESFNLAKTILGFGNQNVSFKKLKNAFSAHSASTIKSQTLSAAIPLMYYPFGLLVLIIGLFVSQKITLPLSETAVLFYSLLRVIPAVTNLTEQKSLLDNLFPSYEQVMNLKVLSKELRQQTGGMIFYGFNKEILIERLTFAYPGHNPTLVDINMRIPKGKMVAIVGESGVGKSTLIDMVMVFHEPTSGQILLDGIPIQHFNTDSYRCRIGYVPQDSVLFNMSIRDNLLWAKEDATEKDIKDACRKANAEEFIKNFSHGYDTIVGDRGVRLSGGQIQRITLAMAILRNPELLILDEATSALDTYSERLIQDAIEVITKQTTVIVVAHRLSTIINADYIYVLKNGRIAEEGAYSELIQKNGHFSKMIELQALDVVK